MNASSLILPLSRGALTGMLLLYAAGARAEASPPFGSRAEPGASAPYGTTWSQEVLSGVEQDVESPELRTLRLAEEELFGAEPGEPDADGEGARAAPAPDAAREPPPEFIELQGKRHELGFLKGLSLPSLPVRWDRRVIEYLLFFKQDPRGRELAAGWLKRRERYGAMIRRVLEEHGLPADLQYVAMVESGFDPTARSQVDAWGMWQFMQQPGSSYGLRIDRWVDERLDAERSTRAAARFMRDLVDRFGSYELAFAAYNMGYGGLLRAIKKYNSNDYWLLSHLEAGLPFETSLYVAKITAMAIVGHNPERFGFSDLVPEKPRAMAKVDVAPGTSLDDIASAAGIGVDQLRIYNPHLKQGRTPPGEDVQVYVPREVQVTFTQRWAARGNAGTPVPYTVRLGESLEDLARRAETSVQSLRELNELATDERIKPGMTVFVPAHATPTRDMVEPLVASVPPRDFSYDDRRRVFYRVSADDSAPQVAEFFEVSLAELVSWNSLSASAALQPGMLLQLFVRPEVDLSRAVVYAPEEVRILTVGSDEFFAYHEAQRGRERVRYRVQPGDTLTSLGQRFDMTPGSLGRINQFASDRELRAGETMMVYAPKQDVADLTARGWIAPLHEGESRANERHAATAHAERGKRVPLPEDGERTWGGQLMEPRTTSAAQGESAEDVQAKPAATRLGATVAEDVQAKRAATRLGATVAKATSASANGGDRTPRASAAAHDVQTADDGALAAGGEEQTARGETPAVADEAPASRGAQAANRSASAANAGGGPVSRTRGRVPDEPADGRDHAVPLVAAHDQASELAPSGALKTRRERVIASSLEASFRPVRPPIAQPAPARTAIEERPAQAPAKRAQSASNKSKKAP